MRLELCLQRENNPLTEETLKTLQKEIFKEFPDLEVHYKKDTSLLTLSGTTLDTQRVMSYINRGGYDIINSKIFDEEV